MKFGFESMIKKCSSKIQSQISICGNTAEFLLVNAKVCEYIESKQTTINKRVKITTNPTKKILSKLQK